MGWGGVDLGGSGLFSQCGSGPLYPVWTLIKPGLYATASHDRGLEDAVNPDVVDQRQMDPCLLGYKP